MDHLEHERPAIEKPSKKNRSQFKSSSVKYRIAAQIGYITGGMNYGKKCESGIFGKGLSFVGA